MSEIGYTIIGFAIGYFWAMYRVENIKIRIETFNNTVRVNMEEFWQKAEEWRTRTEKQEPLK